MRMVDDAHAAWDLLWRDLGQNLLVPTGLLCLDESDGPWLGDSRRGLRAGGHRPQDLSAAEVERRFPLLRGEGLRDAMWVPTGGVLLARRIVEALARHLSDARGVAMEIGRAVRVDPLRGALALDGGRSLSADLLVVAAGPWAPRLLPALAPRVTPSRQVVVRLLPDNRSAWAQMPMLLDLSPGGTNEGGANAGGGFYLVPPVAGTPLKIGDHAFSLAGDPETDPRTPSPAEVGAMLDRARKRVVGLDAMPVLGGGVCFYDVEPKERFVLEQPAPRSFVLSGFSGHGFKFATLLGLALAAAARDERLAAGLAPWAAGESAAPDGLLADLQEVPA